MTSLIGVDMADAIDPTQWLAGYLSPHTAFVPVGVGKPRPGDVALVKHPDGTICRHRVETVEPTQVATGNVHRPSWKLHFRRPHGPAKTHGRAILRLVT